MASQGEKTLASELKEVGLDPSDWLDKFKKIGIKFAEALQHIEGDFEMFTNLRKQIQFPWEEKALKKLLKIKESRHECIKQRKGMSGVADASVLISASNGRALKGILLINTLEELVKDRNRILQAPTEVHFRGPTEQSMDVVKHFSMKIEEDIYIKVFNALGLGVSATANIPIIEGISINVGEATRTMVQSEEAHEENQQRAYLSTIKQSSVQLAAYTFSDGDLILAKDALDELRKISTLISTFGVDSVNVQCACKHFFFKYGSHVNRGPIHFGGVYSWTCSTTGFNQQDIDILKDLQRNAVSAQAGVGFMGLGIATEVDISSVKSKYSRHCSVQTLAHTYLKVCTTGGPSDTSSSSEWKTGLAANKETWSLTHRGTNFVPVWDIIKINYCKELHQLVKVLRKAWESLTGLQAKSDVQAPLYNPQQVLGEVKEWAERQELVNVEDFLRYLLDVKNDLCHISRNPQAWAEMYLSKPFLQQFLRLVMDQCPMNESRGHYIKFLLQQLVEEIDLISCSVRSFPHRQYFLDSLYPKKSKLSSQVNCHDLKSLQEVWKQTVKTLEVEEANCKLQEDDTKLRECNKVATMNIVLSIHSLRNHLQRESKLMILYEDIFVVTLVYPYIESNIIYTNPNSPVLLKSLPLCAIKHITTRLCEELLIFFQKSETLTTVQAYLLHLSLDMYMKNEAISENQLNQHLIFIKKVCGGGIQQKISEVLSKYEAKDCTAKECQHMLASLMSTKPTCSHLTQNDDSIQGILNALGRSALHDLSDTDDNGIVAHSLDIKENTEVKTLFKVLGLDEYYPKKLTLMDALSIIHNKKRDCSPLYSRILAKIMANNHQCRTDFLDHGSSDSDSDDDIDDSTTCKFQIHPQDGILAIIHCADDILRQNLMSKLATCQLAVPFILPDPFTNKLILPLWSLRTIIKEWKLTTSSGNYVSVQEHECPIISFPTPIISFLRLGKGSKSKSRLMNSVINKSDMYFDHFFHRDCNGSKYKQLLGNGLVDMIWYLPEKSTNVFPNPITFLNLHGDARDHSSQTTYLSQISSMCFILISVKNVDISCIEIIRRFSSSCGGPIIILTESNDVLIDVNKVVPEVTSLPLIEYGDNENKMCIRKCIKKHLCDIQPKAITDCASIIHSNRVWEIREIVIDEDSDEFKQGQKLAISLYELLANCGTKSTATIRQLMLPLQGPDLWQKWANKDKEQHRLLHKYSHGVHDYTLKIKKEKEKIRREQLKQAEHLTPFMKSFLISLLALNEKTKLYFLHCLQLYLSDVSRKNVREHQDQYKMIQSRLNELESKNIEFEDESEVLKYRTDYSLKLENIQEHICSESFGLYHLVREVGQLYEALDWVSQSTDFSQLPKVSQSTDFSQLPKAAANLLLCGFPLEIMDGNTTHVPIMWIKAVFNQVRSILKKDPCIYVLSVLGLQSTGKSTLLNTAFGLNFKVGAGKCTRGIFMHLLPTGDDLRDELHCDYVLVVDTQGLRTPERDPEQNKKHDNELATFVIGLANVTLINIFGGVAGDINDILQTAVHALIRMRKVNLRPSCQFVHQNANESWKAQWGKLKFIQMLDTMTRVAALENKCDEFRCFSDVINFNGDKDIHYLPSLWMGQPPMAPRSRGYSESVQNLKSHLLELMKGNVIKLSTFEKKIIDLWDAILHENFVFSFKNTTEIQAYNSLESQYNAWDWKFRYEMMEWESKTENILNGIQQDQIESTVDKLLEELQVEIKKIHSGLEAEMMEHFNEDKYTDIQAQWQRKFKLKLSSLAVELELHAQKMCKEQSSGRKAMIEMDQEYKDRSWIHDQVKDLISTMKKEQGELKEHLEMKIRECLKQDSLTGDQIEKISEDGILTVEEIRKVLYHGHLTAEEEKLIFERNLYNEAQLTEKFNSYWIELLQKLPKVQVESVDIEREVEDKLLAHVHETMKNKFTKELQKKQLRNWGPGMTERLYFTVEDKHVQAISLQTLSGATELCEEPLIKQAQCITDKILAKARQILTNMCEGANENPRPPSYKPHYINQLLREIDNVMEEEKGFSSVFTEAYIVDLYLTICGYAVGCFEIMMDIFRKRNDPCVYLRDEKTSQFILFKTEYYQLTSETAVAVTLCERFEKCIYNQIKKNLSRIVVNDMMKNQYFLSKRAFKAKVLIDFGNDLSNSACSDLSHFFHYISNAKESLKQWLWDYTKKHYETHENDGRTRLEVLVQNEVSRLIQLLAETGNAMITNSNQVHGESCDSHPQLQADIWMTNFLSCIDIKKELGNINMDCYSNSYSRKQLDPSRFSEEFMDGLKNLKTSLTKQFKKVWIFEILGTDAYNSLESRLIGCCEQCPFCKEQCDRERHDDSEKHMVTHHRPDCFGGYKDSKTGAMSLSICSVLVGSHNMRFKSQRDKMKRFRRYRKYQKSYPNWKILVDFSANISLHWKWFVGTYHQQIAKYYHGIAPKVPPEWQELKWEDVKKELEKNISIMQ